MVTLTVLFSFWIFQLKLVNAVDGVHHKRLLLNDPDVINSRLVNLEKSMQDMVHLTQQQQTMQSTIAQLQAQNTNMQSTMAQLETNNTNMLSTIAQLETKDTNMQSTIAELESKNTNMQITIAQLETKNTNMQATIVQLQTGLTQEKDIIAQALLNDQDKATTSKTIRKMNLIKSTLQFNTDSSISCETDLEGFAAGQEQHYSNNYGGGPSNMLCLPNNPELSNRTAPGYSLLVGTEYQDGNFFANGAQDEDVPCALCRSANTSSSIMIPGRQSCDQGWKMEFHGILASGSYTQKPSTYICLDSHPEFLQAGQDYKDGRLLYATRTKCGSLACPPYVDNMAINCVVCSK